MNDTICPNCGHEMPREWLPTRIKELNEFLSNFKDKLDRAYAKEQEMEKYIHRLENENSRLQGQVVDLHERLTFFKLDKRNQSTVDALNNIAQELNNIAAILHAR